MKEKLEDGPDACDDGDTDIEDELGDECGQNDHQEDTENNTSEACELDPQSSVDSYPEDDEEEEDVESEDDIAQINKRKNILLLCPKPTDSFHELIHQTAVNAPSFRVSDTAFPPAMTRRSVVMKYLEGLNFNNLHHQIHESELKRAHPHQIFGPKEPSKKKRCLAAKRKVQKQAL